MSRRKIIFVNRYFYPDHSATSQLLADLAFELCAGGADVHVLTGRQLYEDPEARLPGYTRTKGVEIHRVRATEFGRSSLAGRTLDYLSFYLFAAFKLMRLLNRNDIVVAKTDPPLISVVAGAASVLKGAQLVNWVQDLFPEVAEALQVMPRIAYPFIGLLRRWRNWSMRIARTNVVLGPGMASRVSQCEPRAELTIINNWALNEMPPVAHAQNELRTAWGVDKKFVVGYSGNMGRAHELRTVIDAATALRDEACIIFIFVGGGPQRAELAQLAKDRRLKNVIFKDYQARQLLHLSLSAVDAHLISLRPELEGFILPSKFYGIVAAGRPSVYIGSRNGDVARQLLEADCGFVVAPGDTPSLVDTLLKLRDDGAVRRRMGNNARALFECQFSRSITLNKWRKVLTVSGTEPPVNT